MAAQPLSDAIEAAGGACWRRPAESLEDSSFGTIFGGGFLCIWLGIAAFMWFEGAADERWAALVMVVVLVAFVLFVWLAARKPQGPRVVTTRELIRRAKALETATADEADADLAVRGTITSAPDKQLPVMLREARRQVAGEYEGSIVKMTAQPFVVAGTGGPCLVEPPFIELVGGLPSRDGRAAVRGELAVDVGEEVFVVASATDEVPVPVWAEGTVAPAGYRRNRIRRLSGTEEKPVQIWRRPPSA